MRRADDPRCDSCGSGLLLGRFLVTSLVLLTVVATVIAGRQNLQNPGRAEGGGTSSTASAEVPSQNADWPLTNLDLGGSRYSPLTQINNGNVGALREAWSSAQIDGASNIGSVTPVEVGGVMYLQAGPNVWALDAATGETKWTRTLDLTISPRGRGPVYGDGKIYAGGDSVVFAIDATTGQPVESFGRSGIVRMINDALDFKYPGRYPEDFVPASIGYAIRAPPLYANGMLYVGVGISDSVIPGGLLVAADAATGAIKWVFNTIPQGPEDDEWDTVKDTWRGGGRYGGGIWLTPSLDPELKMVYVVVGNPSPNYDGSARKGSNLFTNSVLALDMETGKLRWHFQTIHHDIWDWDLSTGPLLFDARFGSDVIKGVAGLSKSCHAFMFNRESGQPINPIVETAVPTYTDVPNEEPWPTQPIPHSARGVSQQPFCATYARVSDPELAARVRPTFHPYLANEFVITAPGNVGGANWGAPSFSQRTGLLYVTGKNDAWSIKVKPVGGTVAPGPTFGFGHFGGIAELGETGIVPTQTLAAYDPLSGELVWYQEVEGTTNSGNLVTAGDLVFQGLASAPGAPRPDGAGGYLLAFDARSGEPRLQLATKTAIRADPITYQVGGTQYVAVVATHTVMAFALP